MKAIVTVLVFITGFIPAFAQTDLSGKVTDKQGQPVIGANIFIKGTYDGASSDTSGFFTFSTDKKENQVIIVTLIGYKKQEKSITILTSSKQIVNITLEEERNELNTVVISAGSFEASDAKRATVLKPLDIVTTAGATADLAGAINTLPGAQKVGEEGKLFVRGGDSYETQTFIDGMMVQNPYNASVPNLPNRGRFSPFLFSGTVFSSGGYSAEYGQALSSALILNTTDLADESQTGISLLAVGGNISETKRWEKTSLSVTGDYTNLAPLINIIKQRTDWVTEPRSVGGSTIFRHQTSETGMLKFYGSYNNSHLALNQPNYENPGQKQLIDLKNGNLYLNGTYKEILNPKWILQTGVAYSQDNENINLTSAQVMQLQTTLAARATVQHQVSEDVWVKFGAEQQEKSFDQKYITVTENENQRGKFTEHYSAGFAEADIYLSNRLVLRPGLRLDYSGLFNQAALAPRLSVAYKTGTSSQVAGAFGKFYQSPINDYVKVNQHLKYEEATHYILNYQKIEDKRTFRVEGFYKNYANLVKYDAQNIYVPTAYHNTGHGFAKGAEIFWRDQKTVKGGDYWVSYSYLDTKRNYKNFPAAVVPTFASKHNLSLVYKHWLQKLNTYAGATYSYASSRPYHNPNLEGFNQGRTPAYQDLSVNFSYLTSILGNYTILYVSCTNVLGFDNTFGYRYSQSPGADGQFQSTRITQPAKRFALFALLISIDKKKAK